MIDDIIKGITNIANFLIHWIQEFYNYGFGYILLIVGGIILFIGLIMVLTRLIL